MKFGKSTNETLKSKLFSAGVAVLISGAIMPTCVALAQTGINTSPSSTAEASVANEATSQPNTGLTKQVIAQTKTATEAKVKETKKKKAAAAKKKAAAKKAAKQERVIKTAKKYLGVAYVYGGSTPAGFDCSGFTMYVYNKLGISLTHNAQAQYSQGTHVSKDNLEVGDLVFFGSSTSSISHVGIYVGNGKYIHSPQTGDVVSIDKLSDRSNYVGACRVLN